MRDGFYTFGKILVVAALFPSLAMTAQEKGGWEYDSLSADAGPVKPEAQLVYAVLQKMLDQWNAHDIDGLLEAYWKSPELLVVIDSEEINGWRQLHDSYLKGYPDRTAMGFIEIGRVQVRLLSSDLALVLSRWTINFPSPKEKVVGNTTMNLQKFADGWKIVASHFSSTEM